MGFFADIVKELQRTVSDVAKVVWREAKVAAKDTARDALETTKMVGKEMAKEAWEATKSDWRRMKERDSAPIPDDVQAILERTPAGETPVIPYREDTLIFKSEFKAPVVGERREFLPGSIRGRSVQLKTPSDNMEAAVVKLYDVTKFEPSFEPPVSHRLDELLRTATTYEWFTIPYDSDLLSFTSLSCEDEDVVRSRGWLPGIIRGRRMRADVTHLSKRELTDLLQLWWDVVTERSLSEPVPKNIEEILEQTSSKSTLPLIPYCEELHLWLSQFIPYDPKARSEVRARGWVRAVVRGRKVRAEIEPLIQEGPF